MAGNQKPKPKGERSDRPSGKKPKSRPRTNEEFATGRTIGGYTPKKIAERAAARSLTFDRLVPKKKARKKA